MSSDTTIPQITQSPDRDATVVRESADENSLPKALWVWNNQARLSLPRGLAAWLALVVGTALSSTFFVEDHAPARWVLGGFVVSHLLSFGLPCLRLFTMRRGIVSLMHLVCWSPGWIAVATNVDGHAADEMYQVWSGVLTVVLSVSFVFDVRDAATYLFYAFTGRLRSEAR